jgi:hypothetical protein
MNNANILLIKKITDLIGGEVGSQFRYDNNLIDIIYILNLRNKQTPDTPFPLNPININYNNTQVKIDINAKSFVFDSNNYFNDSIHIICILYNLFDDINMQKKSPIV